MDRFASFDSEYKQAVENAREPWSESLPKSVLSDEQLDKLEVQPRPLLIEPWCRQGDLGFVFAARGVGKTWLGIHTAHCLAANKDFGPWKVPRQENKVLYMDGEMALADIQYRNHLLRNAYSKLFYLNHEVLFERSNRTLNLSNSELQGAVLEFCKIYQFSVLILDNLSCLVSGVDENSGVDWEKILPWLLDLRRAKITVIFIHHAGREGYLRGHSKREDPASWIIHLRPSKNDPENEVEGAHFISGFDKYRNAQKRPDDIEWNFMPLQNGANMVVRFEEAKPMDIFLELVKNGVSACNEIAEEMDCSRVVITRLAKKAELQNLIEINKRKYYIKTSTQRPYNPSND
jgi:putative DNA primase/helicase